MTFAEFLYSTNLPSTAKELLPMALSEKVKNQLVKRSNAEEIIVSAINEINLGSIETIEALIKKRLK